MGVDVAQPRLSWTLRSDRRGAGQTAYQVLVAADPKKLAADEGNLWDSGRVASPQSIQVAYAGKPLESQAALLVEGPRLGRRPASRPTGASRPAGRWACWHPADWKAQWIADPVAAARVVVVPHNGYHSALAKTADVSKWVAVDLGRAQRIDAVRLYPARPFDWQPDTPGFLFPLRFKVEVAGEAGLRGGQDGRGPGGRGLRQPGHATRDVPLRAGRGPLRAAGGHAASPARSGQLRPGPGRDGSVGRR